MSDAQGTTAAASSSNAGAGADVRLFAAVEAGYLAAAQAAVADGASVRAQNANGYEPLHLACVMGYLDVAQWLHGAGASVDATTSGGETPLHYVCWHGRFEIAKWLCSAGADATFKSSDGVTPAQILQRRGPRDRDEQAFNSTLSALLAAERAGVSHDDYEWALETDASCRAVYQHGIDRSAFDGSSSPCDITDWHDGWFVDQLAALGVRTSAPTPEEFEVSAVVRP